MASYKHLFTQLPNDPIQSGKKTSTPYWIVILSILFIFSPTLSFAALTPIARLDLVPLQRIEYGSSFNVGVIAFSKPGIDRVVFHISGQGYSGGAKTVRQMTYNPRTEVWEYWVPIASNEFTSNGQVTVSATAYGKDGGSRTLEGIPLIVEATGAIPQPKAWVKPTGNDANGTVNNRNQPYKTIAGAMDGLLAANNNDLSGCIIYLFNGHYTFAGVWKDRPASYWLTITKDQSATTDNTIINGKGGTVSVPYIKLYNITIQSPSPGEWIFHGGAPENLWTDRCRIIGSGRWKHNSNPIYYHQSGSGPPKPYYSTNTYTYDVQDAYRNIMLVRGCTLQKIGNDAFHNSNFVVNTTVDDVDNGTTGLHADVYQLHTTNIPPNENTILYNFRATNAHYQGIFTGAYHPDTDVRNNIAFVNVLIEMKDPANKNESGQPILTSFTLEGGWNHLLVWNCSFPYGMASMRQTSLKNSSFIGNIFWQIASIASAPGEINTPFSSPGNPQHNEFMNNHYIYVYGVTSECTPSSAMASKNQPCPHWYAKAPDSNPVQSYTTGENIFMTNWKPKAENLLNRFPCITPADADGNARGAKSDIGAIEKTTTNQSTSPPEDNQISSPTNFQIAQ